MAGSNPGADPGSNLSRRRVRRWQTTRFARVPPPGPELTLRPHSRYALGLELLVAVLGVFWFVDAVSSDPGVAVAGLAVAVAFGAGGPLAYRRCTHVGPDGVRIQGVSRVRTLSWSEIAGFEMLRHVRGRVDRIGARTHDGELVALIHPDAKGLSMRPAAAQAYYDALIERIETVRRTAGH